VSLGPLPQVDQLVFKALQTYSDGDIVRWIEVPAAGAEAEHPAPVLKLAKATSAGTVPAANTSTTTSTTTDPEESGGTAGIVLGVIALVAALAALATSLLTYRKATHPSA
jgi:hypothetical protein